ncbi:MAG: hypothetical protein JZU64_05815 [Rhodoferax sp.]|jgi:hypothetical protein|nr:hypothetical protein [Rhodoferax sp.]
MGAAWTFERMWVIVALISKGMFLGILGAAVGLHPVTASADAADQDVQSQHISEPEPNLLRPKRANFAKTRASADVMHMADWIVDSGDNHDLPFVLVDKKGAKVYVFHGDGRLLGVSPALLGLAIGDDAVPGIGERKLASILPEERTTPAGRFVASMDHNLHGGDILWVDYEGAISLHPVITSNPKERRAQRLATATPLDNRISYGCINVPAAFFKNVVSIVFKNTSGIVYVLPETRPVQTVFHSYNRIPQ